MTLLAPLKSQVDSQDPDDAQRQLAPYYCEHKLTVKPPASEFRARQLHARSGGVNVFHLSFGPGTTRVQPVPFGEFVLVSRVLSGQFRVEAGDQQRLLRVGDAIAFDPLTHYSMQWEENCSILTMQLSRSEVQRVATDRLDAGRTPLRFPVSALPDPRGLRSLDRVSRFLIRDVLEDDMLASPLLRNGFRSFLAAAVLDTFPHLYGVAESADAGSVGPAAVRRAVAFIEEGSGGEMHVEDIAAAAGLSPRALQEAFRKHLDTTPMAYLRLARLRHARAELRHGSDEQTVASIAYRCGFHNLGRFAQYYRKEFGQLPSDELRNI